MIYVIQGRILYKLLCVMRYRKMITQVRSNTFPTIDNVVV